MASREKTNEQPKETQGMMRRTRVEEKGAPVRGLPVNVTERRGDSISRTITVVREETRMAEWDYTYREGEEEGRGRREGNECGGGD